MIHEFELEMMKDELAARRAELDQRQKIFEETYPVCRPRMNQWRLNDLACCQLEIELLEWDVNAYETQV